MHWPTECSQRQVTLFHSAEKRDSGENTVAQLSKYPTIWNAALINVFARNRHWSSPAARRIQCTDSLKFAPTHVGAFPSNFLAQILLQFRLKLQEFSTLQNVREHK
jgi:hypothetical protein